MCAKSWLWSARNTGCLNSKVVQECPTMLNEMESDDEVELLASGITSYFEDDQHIC
ncbi:hypothetical protein GYH30_032659 [Glycine max]|nr:hypothetical protein GYH30_032659 [Glycine max]